MERLAQACLTRRRQPQDCNSLGTAPEPGLFSPAVVSFRSTKLDYNNLCHTYSCRIPILEVWRNMQARSVNKAPDSDAGGLGTIRGRPRLISGWAEVET